jgi:hypothetical protein
MTQNPKDKEKKKRISARRILKQRNSETEIEMK